MTQKWQTQKMGKENTTYIEQEALKKKNKQKKINTKN